MGWTEFVGYLGVVVAFRRFEPPALEELRLVRLFDPRRYFLGELA